MSTLTTTATTNAETTTAPDLPDPLDRLAPHHLDELRRSGLRDDTIRLAGFRTACNRAVADVLGWQPKECDWGSGWVIEFPNRSGHAKPFAQVKLDWPRIGDDGKPLKYESPIKQEPRAYFPPGFDERFATTKTILITEGTKKALCIHQENYSVIGLTGVWNWQRKRLKSDTGKPFGKRHLLPDLADLDWNGKTVIVCFDSDAATNDGVRAAEAKLAETLTACGATVKVARVPADGEAKVGADDYMVRHGGEAFKAIIDAAVAPEMPPAATSPVDLARRFIDDMYRTEHGIELTWHREDFYRWQGTHYAPVPTSDLKATALLWLDANNLHAKPRDAGEVVESVGALCRVPHDLDTPTFLDDRRGKVDVRNILPFRNVVLDITNIGGELTTHQHRPTLFNVWSLPFDYDPQATCEPWTNFLHQVFSGDAERIELLQQWFGLCLTPDTSYQKFLLMIGPKRSGKGTVLRMLQRIVGTAACVSPALASLCDPFGLWQLLGRSVAVFPDAHLPRRGDSMRILEIIKCIVGEDSLSINRKNRDYLRNVRLGVRIVMTVNELPRFSDVSDALGTRALMLPFDHSFAGREDLALETKLSAVSSGVANWALRGLYKLRQAGRFKVPSRADELVHDFRRLSAPVVGFVEDHLELQADAAAQPEKPWTVSKAEMYERWRRYCEDHGHESGGIETFGQHLMTAEPRIKTTRPREDGRRVRVWTGVRLRDMADVEKDT